MGRVRSDSRRRVGTLSAHRGRMTNLRTELERLALQSEHAREHSRQMAVAARIRLEKAIRAIECAVDMTDDEDAS